MRRIVSIIGPDGSGKTTLSEALTARWIADGVDATHLWLGAESWLTVPLRSLLRPLWKRRNLRAAGTSRGYQAEIHRKHDLARRFRWATPIYTATVLADYRIQLAVKFWRVRRRSVIVADRYMFDVVVNLGLTLNWSTERVVAFAQQQLGHMNLPQVRIFLRIEPEESLARKDDIPDVDYLNLRFEYYEAIARAFGFVELDGTRPIAENVDWLAQFARAEFERPHIHYVHSNNEDVGGADKVLALMAKHMNQDKVGGEPGFRASISLRLPTAALAGHTSAGTPVVLHRFIRPQLSSGLAGLMSFMLRTPWTVIYFLRLFGRERPDVVHVNDLYDFLPAIAARFRGVPVVYHLRMIQTRPRVHAAFSWLIPRVSSASVSVSEAVRHHYFAHHTVGHVAETIPDMGNATLFGDQGDVTLPIERMAELPSKGRLVVMIGRLEPWKGQHVFVEAVSSLPAELRYGHVFALVGGRVPGKRKYYGAVTSRALELGIYVLGHRDDVPNILRAADVSVHCSIEPDPFPGVVVESLLAGAATIAADAGGVPELIDSPSAGVLIPPSDQTALASALEEILTAYEEPRRRFGVAGRARALAVVDPSTIDRRLARLYRSLAPVSGSSLGSDASRSSSQDT